jgi:hypothetical protein
MYFLIDMLLKWNYSIHDLIVNYKLLWFPKRLKKIWSFNCFNDEMFSDMSTLKSDMNVLGKWHGAFT